MGSGSFVGKYRRYCSLRRRKHVIADGRAAGDGDFPAHEHAGPDFDANGGAESAGVAEAGGGDGNAGQPGDYVSSDVFQRRQRSKAYV